MNASFLAFDLSNNVNIDSAGVATRFSILIV